MNLIKMSITALMITSVISIIVPNASWALEKETDFSFYDRIGDLLLVGRNNDLYLERIDGGGRRRVTDTKLIPEYDAFISKDGRYVLYRTYQKKRVFGNEMIERKYYMQLTDKDDTDRREINEFIYRDFKKEKILYRNNPQ